jgi:allantoinase
VKGKLAPGYDADIALVQTGVADVVHAEDSASAQGYTPFEGIELNARVITTFLRGQPVYQDGKIVGPARGRYLARPYG